jgi:DNA recombination protein RmuC
MSELLLYLILGLAMGALLVGVAFRFLSRKGVSPNSDENIQKQLNETVSNLLLANDRLARVEESKAQLLNELTNVNKQNNDLNARYSSLLTLFEETKKQSDIVLQEQLQIKEQLNIKTEAYQELSRNFAAIGMKAESLQEQLKKQVEEISNLTTERKQMQQELTSYREKSVDLEKENKYQKEMLDKQKGELEEIGSKFSNEFKLLADKILEDKSRRFTELNQNNIERLLKPLGENIKQFQQKVEEVYDRESKERFSLGKEVEKLVVLNQKISEEANNLTNALKGQVKQQGNWGEMILESILEKSGLVKDREYFVQESIKVDDGKRLQPDVIIAYPDNRKVVIDSKVSLIAYERYCSSTASEDQNRALAEHLRSIKSHIDALSSKNYQDFVGSLDFVMMFVPIEPAFMLAMQTDSDLWNYAYTRRVLIISPTNLIAALKMIFDLWQREFQNRHAIEIAERGGQLYDKFVGFIESITSVGENLTRSQKSYEQAMNQLSTGKGNLVAQAQKLKDLGAKAKKSIPTSLLDEIDQDQLPEPEQL